MALVVTAEILGTEVLNLKVCIPLNIISIRGFLHDVVHNAEDEILHLGVAHVKDELCAATTCDGGSVGVAYNPFGMLFVEFALGIGHFRLNPNTPLQSAFGSSLLQCGHTIGKLAGVGYPITQSAVVHRTLVLVAKPSVVHYEEFATKFLDAIHHLLHSFLTYTQINAFPAVKKNLAKGISVVHLVVETRPAVVTAAHTTHTFVAIGKSQFGCGETFAFLQGVL